MKKPEKCPACASEKVLPILYGYPTPEAQQGKFALGGCVVKEGQPEWACASCQHRWAAKAS